jgi:hypothetical protein
VRCLPLVVVVVVVVGLMLMMMDTVQRIANKSTNKTNICDWN